MTITQIKNATDVAMSGGLNSWATVSYFYNDYNVKGNDPKCKHTAWTDVQGEHTTQPFFNRYCDSCGFRKLFVKYAKFCSTKKGGRK